MNNTLSRNFIIRSAILLFIVAPLLGFVLATILTGQTAQDALHPELRSKEQLLAATKQGLKEFDTQATGTMTLVSSKRYNDIWYLVMIKEKSEGSEEISPAILGDFRNDSTKLSLVVPPGGYLQYPDMSESIGIPYELITEFNSLKEQS
jgi:hypothetical protein